MHANYLIKTDLEIFEKHYLEKVSDENLYIGYLKKQAISRYFDCSIYVQSSIFILVQNGNCDIEINFKEYAVTKDAIILLSFGHFFKIKRISADFNCILLYTGKNYIEEMYSTEMIYRRLKYGVRMHSNPVLLLEKSQSTLLEKRLSFIDEAMQQRQHLYYKKMVLNNLLIFFLDLGNIIENNKASIQALALSRDEIHFQQFLQLLVEHYKTEHFVDYYARQLHITTHYLTLIVKRLSGQTVADFIFQLLYSEAKLLLQQPVYSIQQISEQLCFSDQSAFGKFFKRKSGLSPREFRQQR